MLQLVVKGDIRCEASYYNEKPSVWEPLLEPLETNKGRLEQWVISVEVHILIKLCNKYVFDLCYFMTAIKCRSSYRDQSIFFFFYDEIYVAKMDNGYINSNTC